MKFKSRIEWWVMLVVIAVILSATSYFGQGNKDASNIAVMIIGILIVIGVFFGTYYVIQDNWLIVNFCFMKKQVDIRKIMKIKKIGKKDSSSKMKFNRVEVLSEGRKIIFSPNNIDELITELKKVNPTITY